LANRNHVPTLSKPGTNTMCELGSYYLAPSTTSGTWISTDPSKAIVNSNGYVTALSQGTTDISLTTDGGTVTATINVVSASSYVGAATAITDGQASYKISNSNPQPQGPLGSGTVYYIGYNGYSYYSATRPTNTGYYKANNFVTSSASAGCPYPFYIFRCTTCPD